MFIHRRTKGVECNRAEVRMKPCIGSAVGELKLAVIVVVYPGNKRFAMADRVEAVPLQDLAIGEL